ncbi:CopD family protein [Patulibacter minatonensis]|uniref:CopD family protein n=1 Tax=Patulibacter minatonensis TaxID=298163 RepID=UPI0004AF32AF|nr:CopD family protein [Patulibacter minatonensis]
MRRTVVIVAAVVAVLLGSAGPAAAHDDDPAYETTIAGATPRVPGLTVALGHGGTELQVVNRTGGTVEVPGYRGEPYLRLLPDGRTQENLRSQATYVNRDPTGRTAAPASADASGPRSPARWRTTGRDGRVAFHDHRIHWMGAPGTPAPQVRDPAVRQVVERWRVPLDADGRRVAVTGTLVWKGRGASAVPTAAPVTVSPVGGGGADGAPARTAPAGVGTGLAVARAVRYLAIGGAAGLLVLLLVVWSPLRGRGVVPDDTDDAFARRTGRLLTLAAGAGVVASVVALVLHGAEVAGTGVGDALRPSALGDAARTRVGAWFVVTAVASAWLAVVAGAAARTSTGVRGAAGRSALLAALLCAVLVVAPALDGHAVSSPTSWALVPIQIVHVAGMGAWLGGLAGLVLVLPHALRTLPEGRERLALTSSVLVRFSPVALGAVAVLTLAGTVLAILHLTTLYDLTDTAYGRAILVKVVLLTAAIGVAVAQREVLLPRLRRLAAGEPAAEDLRADEVAPVEGPSAAGPADDEDDDAPAPPPAATAHHVRLALRSEVLLLVAVLAATGALAGYPPPRADTSGPAVVVREASGVRLLLTVDPARTGRNALRLQVTGRSGVPVVASGLTVRAVPPGRSGGSDVPVTVAVTRTAPGRWVAEDVPLDTRGTWRIEVGLTAPGAGRVSQSIAVRVR